MRDGTRARGVAVALASAVAFGASGPLAKPLIEAGLDPLHVVWLRVAGSALLLLPLAVRRLPAVRAHWRLLLAYGLFPVAGVQTCYFVALSRIPVGVALLIEYLAPILVLGWVRLVRRTPVPRTAVAGVVLAFAGLAAVVQVWQGLVLDPVGLLLALGAAVCQVCYFLLPAGNRLDPFALTSLGFVVGALALTAVARPWTLPWSTLATAVPVAGVRAPAVVLLAWVVVVSTVLAYLTGIVAIRLLSSPVAGAVACLETVVAAALAWVLLGEALTPVQVAGGVVVLAGAYVAQHPPRSSRPSRPPIGPPDPPASGLATHRARS